VKCSGGGDGGATSAGRSNPKQCQNGASKEKPVEAKTSSMRLNRVPI